MESLLSVSADPEVNRLVEHTGYATAALTLLPIPGSEILGVMPLHVGMVLGIGHHHGRQLTRDGASELLVQIGTTVGASILGSRLATTAAKFVLPGLGGLIAAPFMFASTLAIGAVADTWFRSGGTVSDAEMRDLYKRTMKRAKSGFDPSRARNADARDAASQAVHDAQSTDAPTPQKTELPMERLRKAKRMLEEGLIDEAEFAAVKERILSEL
ncbi:MAG: hypothetical protein AAGA48_17085 [Myxococcota bacterium]